jgi:integrase
VLRPSCCRTGTRQRASSCCACPPQSRGLWHHLEGERPNDADESSTALFPGRQDHRHPPPRRRALRPPHQHDHPRHRPDARPQLEDPERRVDALSPHDLRHTFAYRLSAESEHNRAELERRLGHANDLYLRLYTNPPDKIAAGYVENL